MKFLLKSLICSLGLLSLNLNSQQFDPIITINFQNINQTETAVFDELKNSISDFLINNSFSQNVNSFHFNESGNYAVKGTAAMEESGHVEWIHCSRICLKNEKGGNVFVDFNISDDTLTLDFEMQPKLHMELIPN